MIDILKFTYCLERLDFNNGWVSKEAELSVIDNPGWDGRGKMQTMKVMVKVMVMSLILILKLMIKKYLYSMLSK